MKMQISVRLTDLAWRGSGPVDARYSLEGYAPLTGAPVAVLANRMSPYVLYQRCLPGRRYLLVDSMLC